MDNVTYATLARQTGLLKDMSTVAQNISNMSTKGYRAERVIFSEFVTDLGPNAGSLSLARANARSSDPSQGALTQTNGTLDLAIEGDGFFLVETVDGPRLTRAGAFTASPDALLVAPDGAAVLDAGQAPVFLPPDATRIAIAADGTLSVDGQPLAQIGLFRPVDPAAAIRAEGTRFDPNGPVEPAEGGRILQGFLEASNVRPVTEIARMIEVQRAYELGQTFLDLEDERIRSTIRTTGQ